MTKLAFITGITGQDGSYLAELLLSKRYKIYGIVRRNSIIYNYARIDHIRANISLSYGDLTDYSGLHACINNIIAENVGFDVFEIYNLAAQSHVKVSFALPEYTANVDGLGTMRLLEIIRSMPNKIREKIRFYQAGTSEMFGDVLEIPQKETTPFNPVSPYGAAKLYAHNMVKIYRDGYGLYAVNGILFNHESSRRGRHFVTMKVVTGIKDIITGKKEFLQLGNLDSERDWGHTKDYVKGMWLMLQQKNPDDFILATGKTVKVRTFVEKAFSKRGLQISWRGEKENEIGIDQNNITRIIINPKFFRPCEVNLLLGDPKKAENMLGWKREYDTIDKIITEMFSNNNNV